MTLPTFAQLELDEKLLNALEQKGFNHPTSIQSATIPWALEQRDILGSAPTGTGKTAAFLLPALQYLIDFPRKKPGPPRVLILTPTRELAEQVAQHARELASFTSLSINTVTGGVAFMNHATIFTENQDVIVATTGRLLQYIHEENFDCSAVEMLILDEADRMLDMGFAHDIEVIAGETRGRKQTLLFSATLEGKQIHDFAERLLHEPVQVTAEPSRRERKKIQQWYYRADDLAHKINLLIYLLQQACVTRAIVFVRKRERLPALTSALHAAGIDHSALQGEMVQAKRTAALRRLITGEVRVLLATDVAARGIDVAEVSHVINFDLPRNADIYLHRIGRTARAGCKGVALSLVEAHDHPLLGKIGRYIGETLKERVIETLRPTNRVPKAQTKAKLTAKGQAKRRATEKAASSKKRVKERHRARKNIGHRRKPSTDAIADRPMSDKA